jgi:hypothetical protein
VLTELLELPFRTGYRQRRSRGNDPCLSQIQSAFTETWMPLAIGPSVKMLSFVFRRESGGLQYQGGKSFGGMRGTGNGENTILRLTSRATPGSSGPPVEGFPPPVVVIELGVTSRAVI